ncbi:MAG: hypothetical protein QG608_3172 [Actinomycetota bacterium]|nr:hypothetical protein [Actinomycetota bacterium]
MTGLDGTNEPAEGTANDEELRMTQSPGRIAILVADEHGSHLELEGGQSCAFRAEGIQVLCCAETEVHPWAQVRGLVVRVPTSSGVGDDLNRMVNLQSVLGGFSVTHPIVSIDHAVRGPLVVRFEAGPLHAYPSSAVDALDAVLHHLGGNGCLRLLGDPETAERIVAEAERARHWFTPLTCRRVKRALKDLTPSSAR